MGLFSAIGRAIGRGIEKVGDFFWNETISSFGRKVQDACADKVAEEKPYDKKEANIYTTDRLNEILVSFSEGYFQQATSIEKTCIKYVEDYYDKLIDIIEKMPSSAHNAANLRALKSGKSRISKTIIGGIKDPLSKRMSLDDSECLAILKMNLGIEKKEAMNKFTKKVIKEALNNLSKNVRSALNDQSEYIKDYLGGISEEQEKAMQAFKEHFDKMVRDNELKQSDKEKNCIVPLFLINATECVADILK